MKSLIIALAFGVGLPISAFAQDAPPSLKAIEPQAAVGHAAEPTPPSSQLVRAKSAGKRAPPPEPGADGGEVEEP